MANTTTMKTPSHPFITSLIKRGILAVERVTSQTVSLFSVNCRHRSAPKSILFGSYRFQMIWVNAHTITTQMINLKSLWDRFLIIFVGQPVSRGPYSSYHKKTVSTSVRPTSPKPTRIGPPDFFEEIFFRVRGCHGTFSNTIKDGLQ